MAGFPCENYFFLSFVSVIPIGAQTSDYHESADTGPRGSRICNGSRGSVLFPVVLVQVK